MTYSERNKLAHEFFKSGDIDKAIELYELNVQIHKDCNSSLNRLLTIYRKKNDTINQKRILKLLLVLHENQLKIVEKSPKDKRYLFNLEKQKLVVDFVRNTLSNLS